MSDKVILELCSLLERLQQLHMETAMTIEDIRNTIYNSDEEYICEVRDVKTTDETVVSKY